MDLIKKLAGKFIVLDGPDGSGKSTQLRMLAESLAARKIDVHTTVDPGGTEIGQRIREILLSDSLKRMDVGCETLLFMASRAQLIGEVIEPAIQAGQVVLCDRFISATCAYQGARNVKIERILDLGRYAVRETWPDLTIIIDIPAEDGLLRVQSRSTCTGGPASQPDAMESRPLAYHQKVRELFLSLPGRYPGRVELIDGSGAPEQVHERVMEVISHVDF
ncbi:MAG: dTMP kinase [Phycisphaerales bacterium]|nr:dTMP kinase [Phycisphaerales bacterium]